MIISPSAVFDYCPFYTDENGKKCWNHMQGDKYLVTGKDVKGKRFRLKLSNWNHALGINVYQGSRWLIRGNRRWLIHRVYN